VIFLTDPDFTLYQGDALEVLRGLPSESVDCALTSPPFYGLRDYASGARRARWCQNP
jgi:DNA modification methylase